MTDELGEKGRERLEALRAELLAERDKAADGEAVVELDQSRVGRLSRMDAMQQQQMALEQKRRRELMLKRIEGAFIRLDQGTYGLCAKCGVEIPADRMEIDPTAFFCVECAQKAERR